MNIYSLIWFIAAFASLTIINTFYILTPNEKELIYDYSAVISVGTITSKDHITQLHLNGKLHMQKGENCLFLRLSSLTFKLYNGIVYEGYEDKLDEIPIPNEYEDLLRIFKINYDIYGHVNNISTETREEVQVQNIKKGISSMLQLDLKYFANKSHQFEAKEPYIFGNVTVFYNVSKVTNRLVIEKHFKKNLSEVKCTEDTHYSGDLSYFVNNLNVVEKIENIDTFYSFNKFVFINETLVLAELDIITERFQVYNEEVHNLSYVFDDFVFIETAKVDHTIDFETKASDVYNILQNFLMDIAYSKCNLQAVSKYSDSIDNILHLIKSFNTLENLYDRMADWSEGNMEYLDIIHQLLAYAGTNASMRLIKNLIVTKRISEDESLRMLNNLPFYIGRTTYDNLITLEDLLYLNNKYSLNLRNSAILCFSSIIKKVAPENEYDKTCTKYESYFMGKFNKSTNYQSKILYMVAMGNTACSFVEKLFISVINNNANDVKLRLWTMRKMQALSSTNHNAFNMFWPMFNDTSQLLDIRKTAHALLMESQPSLLNILKIHSQINKENNTELVEFHYSYISTISKYSNQCHQNIINVPSATQQLQRKEPTGYYEITFDSRLRTFLTYDKMTTFIKVKLNSDLHCLLIYIHQVQATFDPLSKNLTFLIPDLEKTSIDIMLEHRNQIYQIHSFNHVNIQEWQRLLDKFVNTSKTQIKFDVHTRRYLTNNFGIPLVADVSEFLIYHSNWKVLQNISNPLTIQLKGKYFINEDLENGVRFYNPFADVWQGFQSSVSKCYEVIADIAINIFSKNDVHIVTFSLNVQKHFLNNENFTKETVFVNKHKYYSEVLSKCCEDCQNWHIINRTL
ncbi:hypothetical protein FQA39_LY15354 [Lamprigera yunnana]|nr:hypothetical protein FQA39_LY15354 [Lamprigera yunnana]